jgi:hypothetical protein
LRPTGPSAIDASAPGRSDGETILRFATGISRSSSTECSTLICVPRRAAWRSRCASSGWSFLRNEPTSSTRIEAPKIRDRHAEPRNPAAVAVGREIGLAQPEIRAAADSLRDAPGEKQLLQRRVRRRENADVASRPASSPAATASIASRQSTSCQRPSRFSIGAVRRSGELSASYEKRSRSDSQHSLTASFSSGSTRMTRFWITCTTRFAPTPSCGETDLRRPSSQVRAE